jgi:hypothetical protein
VELILGFIGGVVAVGLKGVIDFYFERRREHRTVRSACRLLAHELFAAGVYTSIVLDGDEWWDRADVDFDHEVWSNNKGFLASSLKDREWSRLSWAYRDLKAMERLIDAAFSEAADGIPHPPISESDRGLLEGQERAIDEASRMLDDVAAAGVGWSLRKVVVRGRRKINRARVRRRTRRLRAPVAPQ